MNCIEMISNKTTTCDAIERLEKNYAQIVNLHENNDNIVNGVKHIIL